MSAIKQVGAAPALAERTFEPIGVLVILQMVERSASAGGVVLPDTVKDSEGASYEPRRGWVVSAGCQCRYVRRGDLVMVQGQIGWFDFQGQRLACVPETQLFGIECDKDLAIPTFKVTSWKDLTVERVEQ